MIYLFKYKKTTKKQRKNSENTVRIQHICSTNTEGLVPIKLGKKYVVVYQQSIAGSL